MRKSQIIKTITFLLIGISIITGYFLYETIKQKNNASYSLSDMEAIVDNEGKNANLENEINNVEVIDINFPFIDTVIETTSQDCSTIGITMIKQYQLNKIKNSDNDMEFQDLQYEDNKIISGKTDDFIIEVTLNSNLLDENANLLKNYMKEGKNRPLFRTRFHIKATDNPATYKLSEIGNNLGK